MTSSMPSFQPYFNAVEFEVQMLSDYSNQSSINSTYFDEDFFVTDISYSAIVDKYSTTSRNEQCFLVKEY